MGNLLSDEFVHALSDMLRWFRRQPMNPATQQGVYDPGELPNWQLVRVTGAATAGPGGLNYYPGRCRQFDTTAGTWSDAFASNHVWLLQYHGAALTTGGTGVYPAIQRGNVAVSSTSRPCFVTTMRPFVVGCDGDGNLVTSP